MRAVIADDDLITRRGIASVLADAGWEVAAEVADAAAAVAAVAARGPDAVILDIRMPPTFSTEGLAAGLQIRARFPGTAVLVLSNHLEPAFALEMVEAAPERSGYLLKERIVEDCALADALHRVVAGGCVVDPEIVRRLMAARSTDPLSVLSAREREVLALVAEGLSNRAIAARLFVGERTVESHIAQVFLKLHIDDEPATNRRVVAVLAYLTSHRSDLGPG